MEKMKIEEVQGATLFSGVRPAPIVGGNVTSCHSLRPCGDGALRRVGMPLAVASVGREPSFADRREDAVYIFTQEDDGTLYVEGRLEGETFTSMAVPLAALGQTVREVGVCGRFVALHLADNRLVWLLRTDDAVGYTYLGEMPTACPVSLTRADSVSFTVSVEAVAFPTAIADPTAGIDAAATRKVSDAVLAAWRAVVAKAEASGYWVAPLAVRTSLRLWDGAEVCGSEAVVLPAMTALSGVTVSLPMVWDSKKEAYTGTSTGTLVVTGYRATVSSTATPSAAWAEVVQGVTLWTGRQADMLRPGAVCAVNYYYNDTAKYLRVQVPLLSAAELQTLAVGAPTGRHTYFPDTVPSGRVDCRGDIDYTDGWERQSEMLPQRPMTVLGYAGYMHSAMDDVFYTSRRGNPFVVQCVSRHIGGNICAVWPQLSGGGAYTRQFLYLNTDAGIAMLCHDNEGQHTTCRFLTAERVRPDGAVAPTRGGVFAVTEQGSLICLANARVSTVLRGLVGVLSVIWVAGTGELWLAGANGTLVMSEAARDGVFTRSLSPRPMLGITSPTLVWTEDKYGLVTLLLPDRETTSPDSADLSYTYIIRGEGMNGLRRLSLYGPGRRQSADMRVQVRSVPRDGGGTGILLNDVHWSLNASGCAALSMHFRLPMAGVRRHSVRGALRVEVSGAFEELSKLEIL